MADLRGALLAAAEAHGYRRVGTGGSGILYGSSSGAADSCGEAVCVGNGC